MCKYCEQKAVIEYDNYFDLDDNSIELVNGGWTTLYIGVNAENKIVLRACGAKTVTDDFIINFCPICGRDLRINEEYNANKYV
jgi:hypothetical protein